MMKPFFIVWSRSRNLDSIHHETLDDAKYEAESLCRKPGNLGHEFHVLKSTEVYRYRMDELVIKKYQ